ncbi:hypothetical protein K7432_006307, partial [Basidiobolus ranarum]
MISPHSSQPQMHPFYTAPPFPVDESEINNPGNPQNLGDNQQHMQRQVQPQNQPSDYYFPNTGPGNYEVQPSGPVGAIPMVPYNAYASLLNKASLNLTGNIDDIMINWSEEETETKRRLVQFWRQHENNVIHCGFQPVAPAE